MTTQSDPVIARRLADADEDSRGQEWSTELINWADGGGLGRLLDLLPDRARIREDLEYMSDTFMPKGPFEALVADGLGADGAYEEYTMRGDDMAGFCWHFNDLLTLFNMRGVHDIWAEKS